MKLKINDKYTITSDTNCYILNKKLLNKKTDEEYLQAISFHSTLDSVIDKLINLEVRQCDLNDVKAIIAHIDAFKKEVLEHEN